MEDFAQKIQEVLCALVGAEPTDLSALARVHTLMQKLGECASADSSRPLGPAIQPMTRALEDVILGAEADAGAALSRIAASLP